MTPVTTQDILDVMKEVGQEMSANGIKMNNRLVKTVYSILQAYFIDEKQYIILQAPTGTGKSVIGFYVANCVNRLLDTTIDFDNPEADSSSYYLTVSKVLLHQINNDIERFNLSNYGVLKGRHNYICNFLAEDMKRKDPEVDEQQLLELCNYEKRPCANIPNDSIKVSKFLICTDTCPYKVARRIAAASKVAVLNYNYFMTVLNAKFNPYFNKRWLTICDEAHKIPQVVDSMFTQDLTMYMLNRATTMINDYTHLFGSDVKSDVFNDMNEVRQKLFEQDFSVLMDSHNINLNAVKELEKAVGLLRALLSKITNYMTLSVKDVEVENADFIQSSVLDMIKDLTSYHQSINLSLTLISERPNDLYISSTHVNNGIYKHQIKDLNETKSLIDHFTSKCNKILFMSATMGDPNEFAEIFDLEDPLVIKLDSDFDFSRSPIILANAGSLTNRFYEDNIDNVLIETIKICHTRHPEDKGIIHTHTKAITERLIDLVLKLKYDERFKSLGKRFVFYNGSAEKDKCIELMRSTNEPLIICGPSLVEGVDLKDDLARFNILVKVPYPPLNTYARKKMDRCSFWYERTTKESIIQAIGRTNRNKDDFSDVYLMDSKFSDIIHLMDDEITNRLRNI